MPEKPERADFSSERVDRRLRKSDFRLERVDFRPVTLKPLKGAKKAKCYQRTDGPTDRPTDSC